MNNNRTSNSTKKINTNKNRVNTNSRNSQSTTPKKVNNVRKKPNSNTNKRVRSNVVPQKKVNQNIKEFEMYDEYSNEYRLVQNNNPRINNAANNRVNTSKINNVRQNNILTSKEKELSKKRRTRIFKLVVLLSVLIVAVYCALELEYFNITEITVKNNEKYTSEDVIKNCSITEGNNVFKEIFKSSYNKKELAYIGSIKFKYEFPNKVNIVVKERYPEYVASDKTYNRYYILDNEGYILEECTIEQKGEELLVEGIVFDENINLGEQINEVYINKLKVYKEIKELFNELEIKGNITKVRFFSSLTTVTLDDKLNITFSNESNLEYKVSFLKGILNQSNDIEQGTIDMSVENPVYSKYN